MNNIISIAIIILVLLNIYGGETKHKKTKSNKKSTRKTHSTHKASAHQLEKEKYVTKVVQDLTTQQIQPTEHIQHFQQASEPIHLISAYTVNLDDEDAGYTKQFSSVPRKLQTIDTNEIKGRDFIKTNLVDTPQIVAAPAPASVNISNEIIGITNAPMYAPVESIDSSVDIFLINQINTTKNNCVSYLDQPIITMNNKANYIKNNTLIENTNTSKSVENVIAFSFGEKLHSEV